MHQRTAASPPRGKSIADQPRRSLAPTVLSFGVAAGLLLWLLHYAPFYGPAYFFWIGVVFTLGGLLSLLRPLRFLLIFDRKTGAVVAGGGLVLSALALLWPARAQHSSDLGQSIDTLLPDYTFGEFHEDRAHASPEQILRALEEVDVDDIPTIRFLMQVRMLAGKTLGENHTPAEGKDRSQSGIVLRWETVPGYPNERVARLLLGASAATPPPLVTSAPHFVAFQDAGYVKVVVNYRVEDLGHGVTRVSTETRVHPTDESARRFFTRYWRIIYPGTAITRRAWLNAIIDHAETSP